MAEFKLFGTYENPKPTNRFLMNAYKEKAKILCIEIDTGKSVASIHFCKGIHPTVDLEVAISKFGISDIHIENSTPLGIFLTSGERLKKGKIRRLFAPNHSVAIFARTNPNLNLGAAFIGFDAMDADGCNRGIGLHGSEENKLTPTEGCIRMYNDDVLILAKMFALQTTYLPPVLIHNL